MQLVILVSRTLRSTLITGIHLTTADIAHCYFLFKFAHFNIDPH